MITETQAIAIIQAVALFFTGMSMVVMVGWVMVKFKQIACNACEPDEVINILHKHFGDDTYLCMRHSYIRRNRRQRGEFNQAIDAEEYENPSWIQILTIEFKLRFVPSYIKKIRRNLVVENL